MNEPIPGRPMLFVVAFVLMTDLLDVRFGWKEIAVLLVVGFVLRRALGRLQEPDPLRA